MMLEGYNNDEIKAFAEALLTITKITASVNIKGVTISDFMMLRSPLQSLGLGYCHSVNEQRLSVNHHIIPVE